MALESYSFSSMKFLLFMFPLIVFAGLVTVLGPNPSNWVPVSYLRQSGDDHVATKTMEKSQVAMAVDFHNKQVKAIPGDSVFNRSSTPPLSIQAIQTPQQLIKDKEKLNASQIFPNTTSMNHVLREKSNLQPRKFSILDRIEADLLQARAAIRKAVKGNQTQDIDIDYIPIGPMYHNPNSFHRSYLEMEKRFKVFVYQEGEPPIFHNGHCKDIYSMEGIFINEMEMNDQFITRDPEKAHVFFLSFSVAMMVQYIYVHDSCDFSPLKITAKDYIKVLSEKYPYWNRSLGADHFMLSCHDWGPEVSNSVPNMYKNSIRALCNANTSEGFKPAKDVSIPEINLQTGTIHGFVGGPSPSKRSVLAFFAGGVHGPIRPILLEHWENKDEDLQVHKYLPKGVSYYDMLRKSKFCLCPSGYEVASPRVVEAIYTGCVPVLISDHYVPPFSDVLNWKSFSVEVSVNDIPNLKNILMSISPRQYIRMQRRVGKIRRHFEVHSPPKRFDVFHMILHSIWLRRLNFRLHDDL